MLRGYHPTFTKYFLLFFITTSVPGAIVPSVNPIFAICLKFQQQNSLKNQYLPQSSSENCAINSTKFDFPSALQ
jgi:hypothetical protein